MLTRALNIVTLFAAIACSVGFLLLWLEHPSLPAEILNRRTGALAALAACSAGLSVISISRLGASFRRRLNPPEYDADQILTEFGNRLARANGASSVIHEAEKLLTEIFDPVRTLPFLEGQNGRIWMQSVNLDNSTELHLTDAMLHQLKDGDVLTQANSESRGFGRTEGLWQSLGVQVLLPLRGTPRFGIIALGKRRSGKAYTARDISFLKTACNQLSLGLAKATLFDQMEQDASILSALIHAQNEIAFSLNAPDILQRLCQITAEALNLECSHTLVWDAKQEAFIAISAFGDTTEQEEELRLVRIPKAVLADLPERAASEHAILSRSDQLRYRVLSKTFGYQQSSMIIMPLRRERELIGLHLAGARNTNPVLTSRHERIARGIGHASSMAFANAYLMKELASASNIKSDFVASMSHELRTPLNHIIGYNDLMIDGVFGDVSDEQQDTLQRVKRSSHNLLDLIEATLDLSRLDAPKETIAEREVDVAPVVAELADRLEHSCKKPGVAVEWKVRPEISTMRTDPVKLQMVLKNLVENAVKFTDRGRVVIDIRHQDDGVVFEVSDTGTGIPKDLQTAIFEPFRRMHDPTASPGVGLGLHIVRRLVDLLQGKISVESEVDLGSCFRVWLPLAPVPPEERDADATHGTPAQLTSAFH